MKELFRLVIRNIYLKHELKKLRKEYGLPNPHIFRKKFGNFILIALMKLVDICIGFIEILAGISNDYINESSMYEAYRKYHYRKH